MRKVLLSLTAPLLSMAILTVGNGFLTTLTSLGIRQFESNAWVTGLIIASYFIGLMLGAWQTQPIVQRIGLIRAYAAFASITAVATLAQGMFADSVVWMVARFVVGYALAGLFIVIEGWVMAATDKSNSGRVFAFYLLSYYIAQAAGQWFLRIHYSEMLMAYAIIAISASLSVLPVCLGRAPAPASESADWMPLKQLFRLAPLGWIATVVAGIVLSVIYAMYPLYLSVMSVPYGETADIMGAMILGGALLQYPLGKLSDCFDRRHVLAFSAFGTAALSLLIVLLPAHYWILLGLSFWLGGFAFTIFPLAASNTRDYTDASQAVPVMAALNILYSVGSVLGPLSSTAAMYGLGSMGLFISMGTICALLGLYALLGARRKPLHGLAGQGHFGGSVPGPGAPLSEADLDTRASSKE